LEPNIKKWTIHDRMTAVLKGEKPDRNPFIDRLELWHKTHIRAGTLPAEFQDLSLTEIHRRIGIGQQKFVPARSHRLNGAELVVSFEGETLRRETDPVVEFFPRMSGLAVQDKVGITDIQIHTPVGSLRMQYQMVEAMVRMGTEAYMREHFIKDEQDYRTVEYILERAEFVSQYDKIRQEEAKLGDIGYAVAAVGRTPFQQVLLEYLGDLNAFYALNDYPQQIERFLEVLDEKMVDDLHQLADMPVLYIEFGDNLHGLMTNPKLFAKYGLPAYQRYADILHGQGKRMGSHTDGDMKPLLGLLAESGLDVAESFTPAPLTPCTFDEAWEAWSNGPIIWGGIPSSILEDSTGDDEFHDFVEHVLTTVGDRPIILGVGDQVLGSSMIERVQYIADQVEGRCVCPPDCGCCG
jgi:hypothetical protein